MIKRFEYPPDRASASSDAPRAQAGGVERVQELFERAAAEMTKRPALLLASGVLAGLAVGWMLKRR